MSETIVKIIKGRQTWDVPCAPSLTFDQLCTLVESKAGAVKGGLRLLHKGRSPDGNQSLSSAGVAAGTKIMALITPVQRDADLRAEKAAQLKQEAMTLDELRGMATPAAGSASAAETVVRLAVRGDEAVPDCAHVILKKGRESFRVNITLSSTVGELRRRASGVNGIDARVQDIKLLYGGRFLKNDHAVLGECGVKDGGVLMVMFGMRHHDAADAKAEIDNIERETEELEALVKGIVAKKKGRLLDGAELAVERSRIVRMLERLRDNVAAVRGEDERRSIVEGRLRKIDDSINYWGGRSTP